MSRYASAGFASRSPSARREEASSRKRSKRSGAPPARVRVAASVDVAPIVARRAARTSSVRRRSRVTDVWYNSRVKWPAVRVLDRYVIAELISPFCFGLALFTFFLIIDRIYHLTELVIT